MDGMSHSTKFRVIRSAIEEERDGSDYKDSAQVAAAKEIGIGRTIASRLDNHPERVLKRASLVVQLDAAIAKRAPDIGGPDYQALWRDIKVALDKALSRKPDHETIRYVSGLVVPSAYYNWARRALDEAEPLATRLLYGRMAEKVLFDFAFKWGGLRDSMPLLDIRIEDAQQLGLKVVQAISGILLKHPVDPPAGLFDKNIAVPARRRGYRWFRTRMHADHIGWRGEDLAHDDERATLYAEAYKTGLADDLMWLSSINPEEIAHPNNAWNLSFHAGDWAVSARFAARFFATFPSYLVDTDGLLKAVSDDRSVWPGLAAVLAYSNIPELDRPRTLLLQQEKTAPMMIAAITKMIPGIQENLNYVDVLKLGEAK